ncbi:MAG TPA: CRTAC1 family protein [Opitutaceae bacterium]
MPRDDSRKQFPAKRAALAAAFVCLLLGPLAYQRFTGGSSGKAQQDEALRRYGMSLQEVAAASGINFTHSAPVVDPKLANIAPMIASMGASVTIVDYDNDGWNDIYVTSSSPGSRNHMYRNLGNGRFVDVAEELGIADLNRPGTGVCMGAVWGDYDNDGYPDLLVYKWGKPELFHNDHGKRFTNATAGSGLPAWINAGAATWVDYDNDGLLDIFIGGYWPDNDRLENSATTRVMPDSFEYAKNGGRKWLLKNMGGGHFRDVTREAGIESTQWTLAVLAADFNGDGWPDLFVANDYGVSELYLNEPAPGGGRKFRESGAESGIGHSPKSGMNASLGDVLNSGTEAIYVSNISEPGILVQGNNLWVPDGPSSTHFTNLASVMGIELGGWSFGAQFGDLNNDGYLDLYLVNGYVTGKRDDSYWYDFSQITGGNARIISDAANWPAMSGRSLAGHQHKRLWLNGGEGRFEEVSQAVGADDLHDGRAVAMADFENKGALDIVVANQSGPLLLYRNTVNPAMGWLELDLEGTKSNRSAIGARVTVRWPGQVQEQQVVAASGYAAQNQHRLHFGLGPKASVESVTIQWPSGKTQILKSPSADAILHIREEP